MVVSRHTLFEELDKTQDEKDVEGRGKEEGVRRGFDGVATDRLQHCINSFRRAVHIRGAL